MPSHPLSQPGNDLDVLRLDAQLTPEEILVRDTVRAFAAERVMPHIADWFEAGTLPRELAPELGKLGLLGMHLTGYGCAGMGPVAYGVACRELEAADAGLRSLVSVQGSLAMFPIWKYGSDTQKEEWLPRMATGEALGCFGLTEPDHGSDPAGMKTHAIPNGTGWVLSGTKISEIGPPLSEQGLQLRNHGDIDAQFIIVGAVSNATHGSGNRLIALQATMKS